MDKDVDKRVEWLHSKQYSAAGVNIFGEPQKTTRVGDQFQAQIPSLMTGKERSRLPINEFDQSIPVTWVLRRHRNKETQANAKGESSETPKMNRLLVPCSSSEETWSTIEHDSFVLGLYIFGKNLRIVNEFMGNKGMPNVLSYYYGKFYRSSEHQKWSMYRKKRSCRSIPGKKIFNGWRLQELLSRLLPNVSDECKASLTEVIRTFEEGKLSFEKYVFALRDTMGLRLLVQAVAIGKGKQDLTIRTRTRLRSKKVESTCSSLKTEEIVNILKDRIGLSKARLNEFFWGAVWPRLLARGWHYEQATNYAFQNPKNLVFLAPGVTKFSRRSLVKGSQYFDSLTEVLNKVASELHLLEYEPDKVEPHATQGSEDEKDLMKCIVADTSFVGLFKVRELTSLTDDHASASVYGETRNDTAEESQTEDMNHDTAVENPDTDTIMDLSTDRQPERKQKLVFKRRIKCQTVDNTNTDNTRGEEQKRARIVIDLNHPRAGHVSDDANINKSCSAKQSVLSETSTDHTESLAPVANGQRQSRRNRALTTKALEALESGFMNPQKTRKEPEEGPRRRRVGAKMASVSSCGARYLVDGVFDGSSHMVTGSSK